MGRSYWFECLKCGYRAKVSGRADRGHDFFVLTILCDECHALYDAVVRLRIPAAASKVHNPLPGVPKTKPGKQETAFRTPPAFEVARNCLPHFGVRRFTWLDFKPQCPVSAAHRVKPWSEPHHCPKCGLPLEKNALPYRVWD